ncbi:MAG: class III signal peptide-containing protein [archaeon]|nr:class III signal peptide-containing protein [archaeon]
MDNKAQTFWKSLIKIDHKGQTAIEYLLILAGVVTIAAVIIALLANLTQTGKTQTDDAIGRFFNQLFGG